MYELRSRNIEESRKRGGRAAMRTEQVCPKCGKIGYGPSFGVHKKFCNGKPDVKETKPNGR